MPFCTIIYLNSKDYETLCKKIGSSGSAGFYTNSKDTAITVIDAKYATDRSLLLHEYQHAINNVLKPIKESIPTHNHSVSESVKTLDMEAKELGSAKDELLAYLYNTSNPADVFKTLDGSNSLYQYRKTGLEFSRLPEDFKLNKLKNTDGYKYKLGIMTNALYSGLDSIKSIYSSKPQEEQIQICIALFRDANPENWASLAKLLSAKADKIIQQAQTQQK